jgi:hypothetical protein
MGGSTTNKTKPDNTAFHDAVASLVCEKSRNARAAMVHGAPAKNTCLSWRGTRAGSKLTTVIATKADPSGSAEVCELLKTGTASLRLHGAMPHTPKT